VSSVAGAMEAGGLAVSEVHKAYRLGPERVEVLRGISFALAAGEALALTGPSGSGKSTLLHILGTLDRPTSGTVTIGGVDPLALPEAELARFRNQRIGFVFQDHYLLPQYSVLENALLPSLAFPQLHSRQETEARAAELLGRVGLGHRLRHRPAELSGGERQRAAIARALVLGPALLLCDEPTGNLDRASADAVADLLFELHERERTVLVVVTHSRELAARFGRRFELSEGQAT
jgi:lipoprotein-releasing system ATP-binding protein